MGKAERIPSDMEQEGPISLLSVFSFIKIGRGKVKLSMFAENTTLHMDRSKHFTQNLLELINQFYKVKGYKINTQKQ